MEVNNVTTVKKTGHTEDTCWDLNPQVKCFQCGKVGHIKRRCTERPQAVTGKRGNIQHLEETAGSGELNMEAFHCLVFQADSQH
mgnify:CR=1 FL=1